MPQKISAAERQEAIDLLKKFVQPSTPIYAYCAKVSASGLTRQIVPFVLMADGRPQFLASWLGRALGLRINLDNMAVIVNGSGFNAYLDVVQDIERACGYSPRTLTYHEL